MNGSETENNFSRAQLPVSASQPTRTQAADARPNGNPRPVLFGRRAPVPRRLVRTNGRLRRFAKVCRRLFSLMPETAVRNLIELCHHHNVLVSTGGFLEHVLAQGSDAVRQYVAECKRLGFDIIEISAGFISISTDDWLRLIELVRKSGLKPKPEVGIQFGAGGATAAAELQAEGTRDPDWAIAQAKRFLEAGAEIIMIESEGITENVDPWRTDVPAKFINEMGMDKLMFEAADPDVFAWYIKNYGPDVNLFVDHSQIVQLECLRAGIWGTKSLWGRVVTYRDS